MEEGKALKGYALVNLQGGIIRTGRTPCGQMEIYPRMHDARARQRYINTFSTQKIRLVKVDILF